MAAGWFIARVVSDSSRVILSLDHAQVEEPMAYMLTPHDAQAPAIASSDDYNLGLIWEKTTPSHLDEGQLEALDALQALLGLHTPSETQ